MHLHQLHILLVERVLHLYYLVMNMITNGLILKPITYLCLIKYEIDFSFHIRYYFLLRVVFFFFFFYSFLIRISFWWFWLLLEIFDTCDQTRIRSLQLWTVWSTTCFLEEFLGYSERKGSIQSKIRSF